MFTTFGNRKSLDKRGGGEYQDFPSKSFASQCRKFLGEPFTVAIFSGIDKVRIKGGGVYHDFPWKFFCLTVPEYFVGELFCAVFRKVSGIEKNGIREVEHQDHLSKFFWSLIAESFRRGIFYCCINLGCRKSLDKKRGVARFSVENFLVSLVP